MSAKDKKTNKEQKVEIKAGSGLSPEEIERMKADAEAHREEDKKFHELVQTRNSADALVHGTRAAIKEHGGKVGGEVMGQIETALSELESAMKGDDKSAIESRMQTLQNVAQALAAAASSTGAPEDATHGAEAPKAEDVVDAEFTEVKDGEK